MIAHPDTIESTALTSSSIAGWYGKMPCLGDFASRRLPSEFIAAWDPWLQRSIAASRQQLGESWLDLFLRSPMWRFALAPGVCGEQAWAGLLLPSVDKVGRYFPLTLALPLEASHADMTTILTAQAWYAELEKIGLSALDVQFSPEQLEAALAENPFPSNGSAPVPTAVRDMVDWLGAISPLPQTFQFPSVDSVAAVMEAAARAFCVSSACGKTFWWSVAQESGAAETHCSVGLPPDEYFTVMLGGSGMAEAPTSDPLAAFEIEQPEAPTSDPLKAFGIEQPADDEPLR